MTGMSFRAHRPHCRGWGYHEPWNVQLVVQPWQDEEYFCVIVSLRIVQTFVSHLLERHSCSQATSALGAWKEKKAPR